MGEEAAASTKLTGIRHIMRLKEILQKWQTITLGPKHNRSRSTTPRSTSTHGGISPAISKRLKSPPNFSCDSDEESCHSPAPPPDVPKGYLAVYVGPELRRFIIPTSYLSHRVFKVLLEKTEEEFGFEHKGALTFPCETETFKYLLNWMRSNPGADDQPNQNAVNKTKGKRVEKENEEEMHGEEEHED